jgi:hypothetical protein
MVGWGGFFSPPLFEWWGGVIFITTDHPTILLWWGGNGGVILHPCFRNADGVMIFYDCTERASFEEASRWADLVSENRGDSIAVGKHSSSCRLTFFCSYRLQ